jgi:hypothetical protein
MLAAFLILAASAPSASDVQAVELTRALEPYRDRTRDGRAYVEFAPTVETRNVRCSSVNKTTFDCEYDARAKGFLDAEFASWEPKRERIVRRNRSWKIDSNAR